MAIRTIRVRHAVAGATACLSLLLTSCGDSPTVTVEKRTLTVVVSGTGEGRIVSTPNGIDCTAGTCAGTFPLGTTVLLTPTTSGQHTFSGWSGGCTGNTQCVLTMSDSVSVGAVFMRPRVMTIEISPNNPSLAIGDSVKLTAVARDASGAVVTGRTVTWTSFNTAFATVSSSGVVTAVDGGGVVNIGAAIAPDLPGGSTIAEVTVNIIPPDITLTATDPIARELDLKPGEFTVTRSGATTRPLTVTIFMSGTALSDYELSTAVPTIPAGSRSTTVKVLPHYDTLLEGPETAIASLAPSTRYHGINTATVTIEDAGIGPELKNGLTVTDSITKAGEIHIYHFDTALEFGFIAISAADTSNATLVPDIRLMAPANYELGHGVGQKVAQVIGGTSFGKRHGVLISSGDSAHVGTGRFTLTFTQVVPDTIAAVSPGDEGGVLIVGTPRTGTLYAGDIDTYTFTLTQTAQTLVEVRKTTPTTSTLVPRFHLIRADGQRQTAITDPAVAQYNGLLGPGTYTLVIVSGDALGEGAGNYQVLVTQTPP